MAVLFMKRQYLGTLTRAGYTRHLMKTKLSQKMLTKSLKIWTTNPSPLKIIKKCFMVQTKQTKSTDTRIPSNLKNQKLKNLFPHKNKDKPIFQKPLV